MEVEDNPLPKKGENHSEKLKNAPSEKAPSEVEEPLPRLDNSSVIIDSTSENLSVRSGIPLTRLGTPQTEIENPPAKIDNTPVIAQLNDPSAKQEDSATFDPRDISERLRTMDSLEKGKDNWENKGEEIENKEIFSTVTLKNEINFEGGIIKEMGDQAQN